MTEFIGWLMSLVVAPMCAFLAIWLIYRVATRAQASRALSRRQEAWLAALLLGVACMEALNSLSLADVLPAKALAEVSAVALASDLAVIVAIIGLIGALIPGIWWLLLPWWAP